jgi:hypothetical protein
MDTIRRERNCSVDCCEDAAVAFLAKQALCLNHFLTRCYEHLDRIDPRARKHPLLGGDQARARDFVEECSSQALSVCLQANSLSNLERGRLLDILLWAGELYAAVRPALGHPFADFSRASAGAPVRLAFAKR